jgi:hypothetical protein
MNFPASSAMRALAAAAFSSRVCFISISIGS